ncbi:hypothetical protein SUGI_0417760 [Cryptomeria japonica]|nr:hypothetical protein SUGI_0417760 [Cryptomeria japonica]
MAFIKCNGFVAALIIMMLTAVSFMEFRCNAARADPHIMKKVVSSMDIEELSVEQQQQLNDFDLKGTALRFLTEDPYTTF